MSRPAITPDEAEALLTAPKDARLDSPQWVVNRDPAGNLATARLVVRVAAPDHDLVMTADWFSPTRQQVRLQLPGASWNICRLCACSRHEDVHWHCLDRYDANRKRVTSTTIKRDPSAIHTMLDCFVRALNIAGFTTPMETWP